MLMTRSGTLGSLTTLISLLVKYSTLSDLSMTEVILAASSEIRFSKISLGVATLLFFQKYQTPNPNAPAAPRAISPYFSLLLSTLSTPDMSKAYFSPRMIYTISHTSLTNPKPQTSKLIREGGQINNLNTP